MFNIKLTIEYDGAGFVGWQSQPVGRSIQAELTKAIEIVAKQKPENLVASGRTDSGVHARAQTVSFNFLEESDLGKLALGVSSLLRGELSVIAAEYVSSDFHARFSVVSKTYQYYILNRGAPPVLNQRVWHVAQNLDFDYLRQESQILCGQHDFLAFRAKDCGAKNAVREINFINCFKVKDLIEIEINGSGFLKQMIRIIVGTLVELALENKPVEGRATEILSSKDRTLAGITAPGNALFLKEVNY